MRSGASRRRAPTCSRCVLSPLLARPDCRADSTRPRPRPQELNGVQSELSSTKTKLRQAERRLGNK